VVATTRHQHAGGELAQTPSEVRWLSLLSVCAVLGRLQHAHVAARAHSAPCAAVAGLPAAHLEVQI